MAIPMPIVQDIRRLDRQGMSRAQIARRLHVDRGTVAKYADMEDCSPKPKADRRYGSKIDPYAHLVDEWLEADRLLPRKQRHTIRRVHDRLLAETDYDGEYSTTMRYVHRWREANRGVPDREGYVRLEWAAGSMQVDFGVARARIAGEMADVHCLVVSLPYSNMRLCVALPGENAECLCHGLMLVFEHIGGVPPVIVMDNATGAGRRNAKGEVALTGVFSAFVAHYRLEVRFCNPYSGNEKGSVENAVGFLRRNLMVPPMRAESYGQLSRLLLERCDGLARDSYCPRLLDVPVAEVFDEERAALMPLPSTAFDPVRWESRTADKYGLVDIDSNRYLAGPDSARSRVLAAIVFRQVGVSCLVMYFFRVGGGDVLLDFVVCMVVGQCTGWFQATSPSWMRLSMMLMPYSVLMRLSRYQTMYSSSIAVNSSIVTPRKLLLWKNSCLRRPKNPSAAALSGEQPFALIDRVSPCSVQMRIHSGHR